MLALLAGAAPAPAQVGTASGTPYPTEYANEPVAKPKPPRTASKPTSQPAGASSPLFPNAYPAEPAARQAPTRRHAAPKPAPQPAHKEPVIKQTAVKPAAVPVPLPPPAPHAAATAAAPAKPEQPAARPGAEKIKSANIAAPKADSGKGETPTPDAAKQSSPAPAGISAGDRLKIEQALFWSGDYSSAVTGEDRMQAAIKSYQKRNKAKITGILTGEQRAELVTAADQHAQEYGWRVVVDPATGIRIGLPSKLVPHVHDAADGTRWSSPHGEVQVETFRLKNSNLAALLEKEKKAPRRKIEHSALSDDGFFISGMQGLKYFSVRAKQRDGEVRGFTLLYDQMMEGIVAPAVVAMASAFSPFPARALPFAALSKKVEYGTGLIVGSGGHIVTAAKIAQNCNVIVADGLGNAEHVSEDSEHALALLRVYGAGRLPALALSEKAAEPGDVTLIGIPDPKEQDGANKLTEIRAKLAESNAIELRQPVPVAGFSGAAALDTQGHFIGMMQTRNYLLASIEPAVPPVRLVTTAAIRDFLARNQVAASGINTDARKAAIRIICVRK
jgi:hypothetical protein